MLRRTAAAGAATALVAGVVLAVQLTATTTPAQARGLEPWSTCDELLAHSRAALAGTATAWGFDGGAAYDDQSTAMLASDGAAAAALTAGAERSAVDQAVGPGENGTNVQEAGVDEPDRVKLRDGRLLVVADDRLQLLRTGVPAEPLGSLELGNRPGGAPYGYEPASSDELLVVGDRALVVRQGSRAVEDAASPAPSSQRLLPYSDTQQVPTTTLLLVDVSGDRPRLLERSTVDGRHLSARLVGDTVRLVTSSRPVLSPTLWRDGADGEREALAENRRRARELPLSAVLPQVVRTAPDGTELERGPAVECADVTHPTEPTGTTTLLVTTLQPRDGLAATDTTAVTADGDLVYASADRLYVATSRWGTTGPVVPAVLTSDVIGPSVDDVAPAPAPDGAADDGTADSPGADDTVTSSPTTGDDSATAEPDPDEVTTQLHAFDTSRPDGTRYVGSGSVPGYLLSRWALSEHEGVLRVATTRQPPWRPRGTQEATSSMVVKLAERDDELVETGRVEGLGVTEQIKAVRWFGDLAAVVTFRQTDPLYLVDLAGRPRVLGELKVPGYSAYLHPVGDGLLLGLGYDADPRTGVQTGMQVSVFDVSDPSAPTLVDKVVLGRGWSDAIDDARAFSYDPERRRASFTYWSDTGSSPVVVGVTLGTDGSLAEPTRLHLGPLERSVRVLTDDLGLHVVSDRWVTTADLTTMTELDRTDLLAGDAP